MSVPFFDTRIGRKVVERDLPAAIDALREIAEQLRILNGHLARIEEVKRDPKEE